MPHAGLAITNPRYGKQEYLGNATDVWLSHCTENNVYAITSKSGCYLLMSREQTHDMFVWVTNGIIEKMVISKMAWCMNG